MNPELLRIKIAEACGLFRIMPLRRTTRKGTPDPNGVKLWYCDEHHGGAASYAEVPHYPNDMNAMLQAQEKIPLSLRIDFCKNLLEVCKEDNRHIDGAACITIAYATAAQRAEAFLRSLPPNTQPLPRLTPCKTP
jgi:hypothetical protein